MKNKKKMCFGVIIGTRAYFNSELAKDVRNSSCFSFLMVLKVTIYSVSYSVLLLF